MKLETSEEERSELREWCLTKTEEWENGFAPHLTDQTVWAKTVRLLRDIDTLLAEVERLRAERRPFSDGLAQKVIDEQAKTIDRLTAKITAAPPLPAEVEEMRKTLLAVAGDLYAADENGDCIEHIDALSRAASLLSRWPGGWRPISTAPKDGTNILLTDGAEVASGYWAEKTENALTMRPACWMVHWVIGKPGTHPIHWQPIPEPPNE